MAGKLIIDNCLLFIVLPISDTPILRYPGTLSIKYGMVLNQGEGGEKKILFHLPLCDLKNTTIQK